MEPDAQRIENTARNTEVLLAMLDHHNLKYTVEEQTDIRTRIRIHFTGEDLPMTLHIILRTDRQIASIYSVMPFEIKEERRNDAALAVTAANHGLIDGSFDLNMNTGEIRFRLTSCYIGTVLTEQLFSYLMFVSAETVDRYNDRFEKLNNGELDLDGFLRMDAEDAR
jgi:hypothetical protein